MQKTFDFEIKLFGELPANLRSIAVDVNGKSKNHDIDIFDLVCVQISDNPGVIPYVVSNDNDFCQLVDDVAKRSGFDMPSFHDRLLKRFG